MQAYSIEFRESVAAARDDGMSTGEVVELFGCSASWARRLMQRRRRDRGTLAPLAPAERTLPDQRALTDDDDRERLREFIGRRPDATRRWPRRSRRRGCRSTPAPSPGRWT